MARRRARTASRAAAAARSTSAAASGALASSCVDRASSIRPTPTSSCTGPSWRPSATLPPLVLLREHDGRGEAAPGLLLLAEVRQQPRVGQRHRGLIREAAQALEVVRVEARPRVRSTTITRARAGGAVRLGSTTSARRPSRSAPPAPSRAASASAPGGSPPPSPSRASTGRAATPRAPRASPRPPAPARAPRPRSRRGRPPRRGSPATRRAMRVSAASCSAWRSSSRTRSRRPAMQAPVVHPQGQDLGDRPHRGPVLARTAAIPRGNATPRAPTVVSPTREGTRSPSVEPDQGELGTGGALVVDVAARAQGGREPRRAPPSDRGGEGAARRPPRRAGGSAAAARATPRSSM